MFRLLSSVVVVNVWLGEGVEIFGRSGRYVDVYASIWQIEVQANDIWSVRGVSPSRLINLFVDKEAYPCLIAFGVEQMK